MRPCYAAEYDNGIQLEIESKQKLAKLQEAMDKTHVLADMLRELNYQEKSSEITNLQMVWFSLFFDKNETLGSIDDCHSLQSSLPKERSLGVFDL